MTVRRLAASDLVQVVRTNLERLEPLLFRTQLHRMWAIAFRNGTLDWNAGRNVKRSADVSGNARHFCDCELNFTGYEGERSGLNHWTGVTQGTFYKSCGYYGKQNFTVRSFAVLWARVQLQDVRHPSASGFCELNFTGCKHHLPITFYK